MRKLLLLLWCSLAVAAPLDVADQSPDAALDGMYSECLSRLSVTCVQTKVLRFVRRLDLLQEFPLMGGLLSVVRVGAPLQLDRDQASESSDPEPQLDRALDGFFDSHVLRVQLPAWGGDSRAADSFDIALRLDDDDQESARKKGGGGKKGMKKMMMMMGMMLMGKMMMLMPMMLMLIKLKALKALLLGSIALLISKVQIFKKLLAKKGGGGGGGQEKHIILVHSDGHGGGGGHGDGGFGSSGGGGGWSAGGGHGGGGGGGYGDSGGGGGGWSSGGGSYRSLGGNDLAYRAYAPS